MIKDEIVKRFCMGKKRNKPRRGDIDAVKEKTISIEDMFI